MATEDGFLGLVLSSGIIFMSITALACASVQPEITLHPLKITDVTSNGLFNGIQTGYRQLEAGSLVQEERTVLLKKQLL